MTMFVFKIFWNPCGRWTQEEGLVGRKINLVIEIIKMRLIHIFVAGAVQMERIW